MCQEYSHIWEFNFQNEKTRKLEGEAAHTSGRFRKPCLLGHLARYTKRRLIEIEGRGSQCPEQRPVMTVEDP
jgi:hypothetical protein